MAGIKIPIPSTSNKMLTYTAIFCQFMSVKISKLKLFIVLKILVYYNNIIHKNIFYPLKEEKKIIYSWYLIYYSFFMNNIVLVWAWWTGMSWLAMMLFDIWYKNIICINNIQTDLTNRLTHHGLKVIIWHGNYQVDSKDFVIYSDIQAIIDGPEITQSRSYQQSPTSKHYHICLTYNQFIAEISKRFVTVCVSGSNGKTSTTAMLSWSMSQMNHEFWLAIVGWLMPNFNHQWYVLSQNTDIQSDIHHLFEHIFNQKHQLDYSLLKKYTFVIEACEHREHFLLYDSDYALITNVERDHVDYYTTLESYRQAFADMINQTRRGVVVTPSVLQSLEWYRLTQKNIIVSDPYHVDTPYLIGSYTELNAGMIASLFEMMNSDTVWLDTILWKFQWVGRRMEMVGNIWDKIIYSDYGHHAPALAGNIKALKTQFPNRNICAIFQPHQAQRVLAWRDDFKQSLEWVDTTIIYRLYIAREDFITLQSEYPRLASVSSFDELGEQFAHDMNAEYVTDICTLKTKLWQLSDDYLIVYFSAWDLDEEMRWIL